MKATRIIQMGEADPANTTSAYYRGLAVQALAAAPKSLQKLVEDGYVEEVVGDLSGPQGLLALHLFAAPAASGRYAFVLSSNPNRRFVYRYTVTTNIDRYRTRESGFRTAARAASAFRKLVDAMESL